jgi:hypothetical protein
MATQMHDRFTRLSTWIGHHPYRAVVVFFFVLGLLLLWAPARRGNSSRPAAPLQVSPVERADFERALVERYEKRFDTLQAQVTEQRAQFDASMTELRKANQALQQTLEHSLAETRQSLASRQTSAPQTQEATAPPHTFGFRHIAPLPKHRTAAPGPPRSPHVPVAPDDLPDASPFVQLPAGSFVASTLLTGAYAPADQERPLPVLVRVNEAFTGPNHTRVPLQGCFAVGKAAADLGSERATIQIARLSCTLPSGQVFERDVSGYVAAHDGTFGVPGQLVRRDATKIGMAALTGFLSGAADALSRAESTVIVSPVAGATITGVTGDTTRYAAYAGLAETANHLARYYVRLANQITPAIQIPAGVDVHVIMDKGVTIDGLPADDLAAEPVRYAVAGR